MTTKHNIKIGDRVEYHQKYSDYRGVVTGFVIEHCPDECSFLGGRTVIQQDDFTKYKIAVYGTELKKIEGE